MDFRIPIGQWVETVVDWLRDNLSGLFDFITVVVRFLVDGIVFPAHRIVLASASQQMVALFKVASEAPQHARAFQTLWTGRLCVPRGWLAAV